MLNTTEAANMLEDAVNRLADSLDRYTEVITRILATGVAVPKGAALPEPKRGPGRPPKAAREALLPDELPPAPAPPQPAVEYAQLRDAVLQLAELRGHKTALAVLANYDVTSAQQLTPDQWPEVLAAVKAALGSIA